MNGWNDSSLACFRAVQYTNVIVRFKSVSSFACLVHAISVFIGYHGHDDLAMLVIVFLLVFIWMEFAVHKFSIPFVCCRRCCQTTREEEFACLWSRCFDNNHEDNNAPFKFIYIYMATSISILPLGTPILTRIEVINQKDSPDVLDVLSQQLNNGEGSSSGPNSGLSFLKLPHPRTSAYSPSFHCIIKTCHVMKIFHPYSYRAERKVKM